MEAREAAMATLVAVLDAVPGERVLIVSDDVRQDVAMAFAQGAIDAGLWVRNHVMETTIQPRKRIPADLVELLTGKDPDIILNFLRGAGEETPFRIELVQLETRRKKRLGHCPGTTLDMLTEGALALTVEGHRELQKLANKLIQAMQGSVELHLTTPAGTDCLIGVEGRTWYTDTRINWETMKWMNLPTGETLIGPVETKWDGRLVCDLAMGGYPGVMPSPLTLEARTGRVVSVSCDHKKALEYVENTLATDDWAKHIGEFAFGLNEKARLHEEFVETEKMRTVHIAIGNNLDYPGHTMNASKTHLDFLVKDPTVIAKYVDGSEKSIIKDGKYLV
ncbi:MAG: aminopeptidase [Candidatus Hodarchaeota archaeon]